VGGHPVHKTLSEAINNKVLLRLNRYVLIIIVGFGDTYNIERQELVIAALI